MTWELLGCPNPPQDMFICEFICNIACVHSHIHVSIHLFIHPSMCPSVSPSEPCVIALRLELGIQRQSKQGSTLPQRSSERKGQDHRWESSVRSGHHTVGNLRGKSPVPSGLSIDGRDALTPEQQAEKGRVEQAKGVACASFYVQKYTVR